VSLFDLDQDTIKYYSDMGKQRAGCTNVTQTPLN